MVEFALVAPVFLILIFAIVDFGLGLRAWITITNAAREGARYAAVTCATSTASSGDVQTKAAGSSQGLLANSNVTVTNCPGKSTEAVVVKTNYTYKFVTPLGGMMSLIGGGSLPNTIAMSSTANMRME